MRLKARNIGYVAWAVCLMTPYCVGWAQQGSALPPETAMVESQAKTADTDFDRSRAVKIQGVLKDRKGKPLSGIVGVLFAIYKQQQGGAPLWQEVQNAELDSRGHFTVPVGSNTLGGIPPELFTNEKTLWLGELVLQPGEVERPRMRLVITPSGLAMIPANSGATPGKTQEASGETTGSQQDQNDRPPKTGRKSHRRPSP
jgi:hypothetical protein